MDDKTIQQLKWVIFAAAFGTIAYFALPIVAKLALDALTIALCGVAVLGLWIFLPAVSEAFAQMAYRLWELAIRSDPIAKCRRNLVTHAEQIAAAEKNISLARSGVNGLKTELKDPNLSREDKEEGMAQIKMLEQGILELEDNRNEALAIHADMERQTNRAEAKLRVGKAFKSVLSVFAFNNTDGKDAMGARIALQEVDKQLNDSTAQLQTILSRKVGSKLPLQSADVVEAPPLKIPKTVSVN